MLTFYRDEYRQYMSRYDEDVVDGAIIVRHYVD